MDPIPVEEEMDIAEEQEQADVTDNLELIPESVWLENILPLLSPSDFLSIINLYRKAYDSVLTSQLKIRKLFPLVVTVVVNRNISRHDFLQLRLVNPEIKAIIDQLIDHAASPAAYWENVTSFGVSWTNGIPEQSPRRMIENMRQEYRLGYGDWNRWMVYIDEMTQQGVEAPDINPFLLKSASLPMEPPNADLQLPALRQTYIPNLHQIMQRFGSRFLTNFAANANSWVWRRTGPVRNLINLLRRLPLLQVLKLTGAQYDHGYPTDNVPVLQHLQLLDVSKMFQMPTNFVNGGASVSGMLLRGYGQQLTTLVCDSDFVWEQQEMFRVLALSRIIKLGIFCRDDNLLEALEWIELPLQELLIKGRGTLQKNYEEIVRVISNMNPMIVATLNNLMFHVQISGFQEQNSCVRQRPLIPVAFPSLTKICVPYNYLLNNVFIHFLQTSCQTLVEISAFARFRGMELAFERMRNAFQVLPNLSVIILYFGYLEEQATLGEKIVMYRDDLIIEEVFPTDIVQAG